MLRISYSAETKTLVCAEERLSDSGGRHMFLKFNQGAISLLFFPAIHLMMFVPVLYRANPSARHRVFVRPYFYQDDQCAMPTKPLPNRSFLQRRAFFPISCYVAAE